MLDRCLLIFHHILLTAHIEQQFPGTWMEKGTVREQCRSQEHKTMMSLASMPGDTMPLILYNKAHICYLKYCKKKLLHVVSSFSTHSGTYALKPSLPAVGGNEGVGEVTEVGSEVQNLSTGDHVVLRADQCLGSPGRFLKKFGVCSVLT